MAPKQKTRELEAAFHEAGLLKAEAVTDHVRVWLDGTELDVRPVSAGHGRPQEVRDALARVRQVRQPHVAATLVAEHYTSGALDLLQDEGANYLDDCRFVFRHPAPFVAIKHDRRCEPRETTTREPTLAGKAGMAVQEMLLEDTEWWRVTELAEAASVAAGTAQTALRRLEAFGLVDVTGSGPNKRRCLRDKGAVLERWVQDARRERHRLLTTFVLAQGPVDLAEQVSQRLKERHIEHAVTGACAALLVAPHATDVRTCELWVDPATSANLVADALGVQPVQKGGNVVVLQAKTDAPLFAARAAQRATVVNPLRLYADLLEDPKRGEEQARFLRQTVLGI